MMQVTAELNYLAPGSPVLRRFAAPGRRVNTGTYEIRRMPVRDGRPVRDQFALDRTGFALIDHVSAVKDFTDPAEVRETYTAEVVGFVTSYTGADRVVPRRPVVRRAADPAGHGAEPPAGNVHCDYSDIGAAADARRAYDSHFPGGPGYRRALVTSLWRAFSPPPQDWPLAVCDFRSVGPGDGRGNRLYFVDEIPEDLYADMPPDAPGVSGFEFQHNPAHQWWYFRDMTRDEILLFVLNDSDQSRPWRVPHTAFFDPTANAARPRHSIEYRTIAYFE